jgi:uncharacterized protein YutE (UPF0331/DUF86 family)
LHGVSGRRQLVDRALILRKFERIETYLKQIRSKKDPGFETFRKDKDLQSIVLFNLIQTIQACADIGSHIISDSEWEAPGAQADIFEILAQHKVITRPLSQRMIKMMGFRNRIVHEYEKIDLRIVYDVWRKNIKDIERYCKSIVLKYKL